MGGDVILPVRHEHHGHGHRGVGMGMGVYMGMGRTLAKSFASCPEAELMLTGGYIYAPSYAVYMRPAGAGSSRSHTPPSAVSRWETPNQWRAYIAAGSLVTPVRGRCTV